MLSQQHNKINEVYNKLNMLEEELLKRQLKNKKNDSNLLLPSQKKRIEELEKIINDKNVAPEPVEKVIEKIVEVEKEKIIYIPQQIENIDYNNIPLYDVNDDKKLPMNNYNLQKNVVYVKTNNDLFNNCLSIIPRKKTKPKKFVTPKIVIDEKIEFTKNNLILVKISGVVLNRKQNLIDNLHKINTLDDILKLKIGIGKVTLNNIKEIFKEPTQKINIPFEDNNNNNLPYDEPNGNQPF
jgi:hypothetical protein